MKFSYFDTSAVNYLVDKLSIGDAIATRAFQEVRGRAWVISPVVIWETLLTSDVERREKIIHFCQRLFHQELLPSPEEFLIKYIERGCPAAENAKSLKSTSGMSDVWKDLCTFPEKTFIVDHEKLSQRALTVQCFVRNVHRVVREENTSAIKYGSDKPMDCLLEELVALMPSISRGMNIDRKERIHRKIAIFYALFLLCAPIGLGSITVNAYWKRIGINATFDRIYYLLKHHESCFMQGPLAAMAMMTYAQCSKKYSRGVYFDSLHSTYLPCVQYFFAEDKHFLDLRDMLGNSINSLKIHRPSDIQWTFQSRSNPTKLFGNNILTT